MGREVTTYVLLCIDTSELEWGLINIGLNDVKPSTSRTLGCNAPSFQSSSISFSKVYLTFKDSEYSLSLLPSMTPHLPLLSNMGNSHKLSGNQNICPLVLTILYFLMPRNYFDYLALRLFYWKLMVRIYQGTLSLSCLLTYLIVIFTSICCS